MKVDILFFYMIYLFLGNRGVVDFKVEFGIVKEVSREEIWGGCLKFLWWLRCSEMGCFIRCW